MSEAAVFIVAWRKIKDEKHSSELRESAFLSKIETDSQVIAKNQMDHKNKITKGS